MGRYIREDHEKFHAIAATLPKLYQTIKEVSDDSTGPVEIDIEVRGLKSVKGFSSSVENPEELLEILRLTLGDHTDDSSDI